MSLTQDFKQAWREWRYVARYRNPVVQWYLHYKDLLWARWRAGGMKRAIKMADARCAALRKNIYVLPDDKGVPRAFTNDEIRLMKRAGVMSKKVTCVDLYSEALYIATPNKVDGKGKKK